ncbi:MAG: F0F1 ATP synthase subunit B [Peptostreptococcaceae bacterium]|nr:F0F1 ATP synthase subunit B [Peptostreptococcaceae bacterium]
MEHAGLIDIQLWQMIFTIANMIILFLALKHFLFKPVKEFMDKRTLDIQTAIEEAEQKNKKADEALQEYEARLASAQSEGREIVEKAKNSAQIRAEEIVEQAKEESAKLKERAFKDIELEKDKALRNLKGEVADMAILATEKLIAKSMDGQANKSLIDEVINEIGDEQWSS